MAGHLGPMKNQPLLTGGSRPLAAQETALRAAVSERLAQFGLAAGSAMACV